MNSKRIDTSCIFCANLNSLDLLFEDDRVAVALHDDWAVRGHAMVIWKEHVENISDLAINDLLYFAAVYGRTERALLAVTLAERAIMMKLGIATPHLHVHIYPLSSTLTRAEVMAIIDGRVHEQRDPAFIEEVQSRLDSTSLTE